MNKFIGLFIGVIALAALAGAAIGWRFPFLGQNQNRATNQVGTSPQGTVVQPANQQQRLSQPAQTTAQSPNSIQGRSNTQTTAQAPQTTVGQGGTTNTQSAQDTNQPVPALW